MSFSIFELKAQVVLYDDSSNIFFPQLAWISYRALEKFGGSASPEHSNLFPWNGLRTFPAEID